MEIEQKILELLSQTLSPNSGVVLSATESLNALSGFHYFPFALVNISTRYEDHGLRIAAATYLKNFIRTNLQSYKASKEFKDALLRALLVADSSILKVLTEAFREIVEVEFVKENSWPELVPELRAIIPNSDLINTSGNCEWKTINALTVLQSLIRPFQYFLDPKVTKEPVPPQLELIAQEILVPLVDIFHQFVEKLLTNNAKQEEETEQILLIICKCIFLAVRSHMPSISSHISSFCGDLFRILNLLSFSSAVNLQDVSSLRLKTGKRILLIFCALVTRHRKVSDKLMPCIIGSVLEIVKHTANIHNLDFLSERIISLAFDVVSRVLETGPGWRLVSPHFSALLNSAIFPALILNKKDMLEWEDDADEYIRKNLPSELEEISGWKEDLFTARKSALNLLGVMAMSKGPPVVSSVSNSSFSSKRKKGDKTKGKDRSSVGELLVLPFLSKFPVPSDLNASDVMILNEYHGVLMAYGSLQDFFCEQKPEYSATLVRTRVLPLYKISTPIPYLIASANWVLGELASCLPEEMSAAVYSSLLKALSMPDIEETSCYPVWVSAAGAITELLQNDFMPPEWLPLLQVVVGRISDDGEETSILFELLGSLVEAGTEHIMPHIPYIVASLVGTISKCIPRDSEPWPQVVEQGFAALVVIVQCWEDALAEEDEESEKTEAWVSGRAIIARDLSSLLQQAWLTLAEQMEEDTAPFSPPPSCIEDSSALLRFILLSVTESNEVVQLKVPDLLIVWANLIASWHAWEESEDLSIFNCIKEAANIHKKFLLADFVVGKVPSSAAPSMLLGSVINGISAFVSEAFSQYPSAVWRASSCVHLLLSVSSNEPDAEVVKQSLVVAFSTAALSRFAEIRTTPSSLWKPLLLALSSCYLAYPDVVEKILEKDEADGLTVWANALCSISSSSFEHGPSLESEIKLLVITLAKVVERLLTSGNLRFGLLQSCFTSLMEASVRFKESQEDGNGEENGDDEDASDEDTEDDDEDEDSDDDEREETEQEFLDRYAKAAIDLENGTLIEEGDVEDQDEEIELGEFDGIDPPSPVISLIKGYHRVLVDGQSFPPQIISSFVDTFPECKMYFGQHC